MKKIIAALSIALLAVMSLGGISAEAATKEKPVTIFLHGLMGGDASMGETIKGLTGAKAVKAEYGFRHTYRDPKTKVLHSFVSDVHCYGQGSTYVIAPDLSAKRFVCEGGREDYVNVVFAGDAIRNTADLELQMKMLKKITDDIPKALKSAKGVNEKSVNFVGHSMGGVLATNYALQSHKSKGSYLKVERLITLGSPISGVKGYRNLKSTPNKLLGGFISESWSKFTSVDAYGAVVDLNNAGEQLTFRFKTMKLDPNMKVLSVYGTEVGKFKFLKHLGTSDGFVLAESAIALKNVTKNFKSLSVPAEHTQIQGHKTTIAAIKYHLAK